MARFRVRNKVQNAIKWWHRSCIPFSSCSKSAELHTLLRACLATLLLARRHGKTKRGRIENRVGTWELSASCDQKCAVKAYG
eukprot:3267638-Amphidinium_carterae.1